MMTKSIITCYMLDAEDRKLLSGEVQQAEMLARLPEEYRRLKEFYDALSEKYNALQEQNQALSGRIQALMQQPGSAASAPVPAAYSADASLRNDPVLPESQPVTDAVRNTGTIAPAPAAQNPDSEEDLSSLTEEADPNSFVIQGNTLIRYRGIAQLVRIPQHIAVIGANAFDNCTSVRRVIIPEGVIRIEEMAFANCSALKNVKFPASLQMINNKAFMNCVLLRSAEFHGAMTQIGTGVFLGCNSIVRIVFDCPIKKIGFDSFSGCIGLQTIEVGPNSYSYKSIDGVLFDYEGKYLIRYPAGRSNRDYIVPDSVFTIEDGAFYESVCIERVKLSRNVKKIGASAFRNCAKLREIIFSENLETIKTAAFQGCISLVKVNLPTWTTYIGTYAFSHCENLVKVNLPSKLTELCIGVFEYCKGLSFIRIPDSIIKIGDKAFMESGLTEVFIPYSTTKIEQQSFAFCSALQSVFLSNRINQIARNAFEGTNRSVMTIYGMYRSVPEEFAMSGG
ncbi:MAG: leucine-rich repeat protein [Oscillospiraceae bacterium]|nr:leucine-rich repeat protein [Oscillospiraceae bacterium]